MSSYEFLSMLCIVLNREVVQYVGRSKKTDSRHTSTLNIEKLNPSGIYQIINFWVKNSEYLSSITENVIIFIKKRKLEP